jgi:hypothetical protein
LEDHFTLLDLSANSGHNLGREYGPKELRAIRRLTIHRVFQLLDREVSPHPQITEFLRSLAQGAALSVITLNWDIVTERHLDALGGFNYAIELFDFDGHPIPAISGVPLLKLHGSTNWVYCDCCRTIFAGVGDRLEKTALYRRAYLERADLLALDVDENLLRGLDEDRECPRCGNQVAGRLATFSYRKDFSVAQFRDLWQRAFVSLCDASEWIFVGYSLPEADFEFKHLLKSAELSRRAGSEVSITAVVKGDRAAAERYQSFFGAGKVALHTDGVAAWLRPGSHCGMPGGSGK